MLNKSRHQSATSQRQYDIPGASLRGPYKRWIPQTDSRLSESETDAPKSSSHRPRGHSGPSSHVAGADTSYAAPSAPYSRYANGPSSQNHAPMSQPHRSERNLYGYSSESTVHAPPPPAKPSSSAFSIFKPQVKDYKPNPSNASKREDLPRSTTAPAPVSSRYASQSLPIPQARPSHDGQVGVPGGVFGSFSTQTSTDTSPRSSTDSGPRSGHASAPAAQPSELRKHGHAIWNPYADTKSSGDSTTRHSEVATSSYKRGDKRDSDKEEMVTRVTEALGGGSTGKAKVVENAILHDHLLPVKGDDGGFARRTTLSTASREAQSRFQTQVPPTLRRQKATPQATPLNISSHLPETASKLSRPSTNSSRVGPEAQPRSPEASAKPPTSTSKLPASTTITTKLPHSRTASSPWPFNQALPTEPAVPKSQPSQSHSTSWRSRFNGSSAPVKPPDVRSPSKETLPQPASYATVPETIRGSQAAYAPPLPSKTLPRSTASHTTSSRIIPSVPPPTPISSSQQHARSRYEANPSYVTMSTEQSSQRWSPSAPTPNKPVPTVATVQASSSSQASGVQTLKAPDQVVVVPAETLTATDSGERDPSNNNLLLDGANAQTQLASGRFGTYQHESATQLPPTASRHARAESFDTTSSMADPVSGRHTVESTQSTSILYTHTQVIPARVTPNGNSMQHSQSTSQSLWQGISRHTESTAATPATHLSPAGTWTSTANVTSYSESMNVSRGSTTETTTQEAQFGSRSNLPTPTDQDSVGKSVINGSTTPVERHVPGAWMSKYLNANLSTTTLENLSTPKPPPKATMFETSTTAASKHSTASGSAADPTGKGQRSHASNPSPPTPLTAGAWTTSSRYATNTSGSIFDTPYSKYQGPNNTSRETSTTMRQVTLGTSPAPGAWTTKMTSTNVISTNSDSTLKQTPPQSLSPPSSSLKPPPPSGTGTGSSTPSSAQTSDINLVSLPPHSISTRVPISGHPSTPAPVRPVLRPTPPPLSISSTSPDTDSLLTPSSLNSPRSTLILPPSQPVSTITVAPAPAPEKDKAQRKGFFDFLRPKAPVYEVWTPPSQNPKERERRRDESPKNPPPAPPKPKPSTSVPIPRPKSPKIFSPFKLFGKRHRTVSSASLDVLDGTAANTVMNSPASSMRADTPGGPPSPPLRDAILATQEWRNKEATELFVSGRKRRHRPGVTFDCPEDIAPADIVPSRLRVARMVEDEDDY